MTASSAKIVPEEAGSLGRQLKPDVIAYKRARILEEASVLFFEKGYQAATLDMLAEQLHVTKPFLYTYFRNKGDILAAVCAQGVRDSLVALDAANDVPGTSLDQLRAALAEVARIIIDRCQYIVVYQREMMNLERGDAQKIMRQRHEFDIRISQLVGRCVKDGFVTAADATTMSMWMGGLLSWIPSCYRPGSSRPKQSVIDEVVKACLRLIGLN